MRVAALYDIHANLPALEAVLADLRHESVDRIVIGGDAVAGPLPAETIALLRAIDLPTHFILGNAESELLRHLAGEATEALSERAGIEARLAAQALSPEERRFVAQWPATVELDVAGVGRVLFCHATPQDDVTVFTRHTPEEKLRPIFAEVSAALVVCGHTHMQFDRIVGAVRVVNAGSVGMPFDRPGAQWLLLDNGVTLRHTAYDLNAAAERIRRSSYPYADEFAAGNVLQTPGEAAAMEFLTQIERRQAK